MFKQVKEACAAISTFSITCSGRECLKSSWSSFEINLKFEISILTLKSCDTICSLQSVIVSCKARVEINELKLPFQQLEICIDLFR